MSDIVKKIYFDHNATTAVDKDLVSCLADMAMQFGNPSSIHWASRGPKKILREARENLAKLLNVSPLEIVFTSGGSESNNTVLQGVYEQTAQTTRNEIIISSIEHPSILRLAEKLKAKGVIVHCIPVNHHGDLDLQFYKNTLGERTALVSVMMANNETGVIHPIKEMVGLAHAAGALFHTDAVQALGKINLDLKDLDVDFASFSAHKFYALKGTGVLYCKKGHTLPSLILGGGQERHRRGGTENTLGIAAIDYVIQKYGPQIEEKTNAVLQLRDYLQEKIISEIPLVSVVGSKQKRLPNTLSLLIDGIDGETLLMALDLKGFAVSTGAACSSGNPEPSHVLLAMGFSRSEAQKSLRVSLGYESNHDEVNAFIDALKDIVLRLRSFNHDEAIL